MAVFCAIKYNEIRKIATETIALIHKNGPKTITSRHNDRWSVGMDTANKGRHNF